MLELLNEYIVSEYQKLYGLLIMIVDRLDDLKALDGVRHNWNTVYRADRSATIFLSFEWMRAYAAVSKFQCLVLGLRPSVNASYVAFFPLATNLVRKGKIVLERQLIMAGHPVADYPGMVCIPAYESRAVSAITDFLRNELDWDTYLAHRILDTRCLQVIENFKQGPFKIESLGITECPYIQLPPDWDTFLSTGLGSSFRRNLRRRIRQVESLPDLRVVDVDSENLESQIKIMIALNEARYGSRGAANIFSALYRSCFFANSLFLRSMFDGETPLAATAAFIDRPRAVFYGYSCGFNEEYSAISPGTVLTAYTIKYAIEKGYRLLDLGRGRERYKFSFGAKHRLAHSWKITRRSFRSSIVNVARRLIAIGRRSAS